MKNKSCGSVLRKIKSTVALFQPQIQVSMKTQLMGTQSCERQCTTAKLKGSIPSSNISLLHMILMNINILLILYSSLQQHQWEICIHKESKAAKHRICSSEVMVIRMVETARLWQQDETSLPSLLPKVKVLNEPHQQQQMHSEVCANSLSLWNTVHATGA